ncbi:MAG: hypothetical protein ACFFAE_14480 [Candidatus Hodarchaeota archaeon]
MPFGLSILVDPDVSQSLIIGLESHLMDLFPFNKVNVRKLVQLPSSCWNASRRQYEANCLLAFASSRTHTGIVVLIVFKDAYVPGLNFVFGIASKGIGAVVSVYRLENDPEFLHKEITHELGHVFGLNHCSLPCVMTFSNSVWEARLKTSIFCERCRRKLKKE